MFWKQDSKNSHNALIQPVLSLPFVQCELYCLLKLTLASYSRRYCSGRALCSPQNPFTENIVARHEPMHCAEVARGQKLQKKRNYMNPRKVYSVIWKKNNYRTTVIEHRHSIISALYYKYGLENLLYFLSNTPHNIKVGRSHCLILLLLFFHALSIKIIIG